MVGAEEYCSNGSTRPARVALVDAPGCELQHAPATQPVMGPETPICRLPKVIGGCSGLGLLKVEEDTHRKTHLTARARLEYFYCVPAVVWATTPSFLRNSSVLDLPRIGSREAPVPTTVTSP